MTLKRLLKPSDIVDSTFPSHLIRPVSQRTFLWADNIDCIIEAILIVWDRLNMSGIELSRSPVVQILLPFLRVRSQRTITKMTSMKPCS